MSKKTPERDVRDDDGPLIEKAEREAPELLRSPDFFRRFLSDVRRAGVVGEERNALALYITGTSRLRPRPVNIIVKGRSSAGKDHLVQQVLEFFPIRCIVDPYMVVAHALQFVMSQSYPNSILYFNEMDAANLRTARANRLIASEGRRFSAACISTAERCLEIEEENRHLSIWMDESADQTKRIARAYMDESAGGLSQEATFLWTAVQLLLEKRKAVPIRTEPWFEDLVDLMPTGDIRMRRHWPAFVEVCKTVALIRSYRDTKEQLVKQDGIIVNFDDFAVASIIFDKVVTDTITRGAADSDMSTADLVARIATAKGEDLEVRGVDAKRLLGEPGVTSLDKAYRLLGDAESAGTIYRVNAPGKNNQKFYLPMARRGFVGSPNSVLKRLKLNIQGEFVNPLTGATVNYGGNGT